MAAAGPEPQTEEQTNDTPKAKEPLLTSKEVQDFDKMGKTLIKQITELDAALLKEDMELMNEDDFDSDDENAEEDDKEMIQIITSYVDRVLRYNVLGGKMLRGLMVPMSYKSLVGADKVTPENMRLAYALGWVLELLQAASLVADDMMDQSETRRGKPCWYKQPDVGMAAVNDVSILEMSAFQVLRLYFDKLSYYRELYDMLHHIVYCTIFGQGLDSHTENSKDNIFDVYTMERYDTIVRYKTSYYTTYMPVICAMIMAGKSKDASLVQQVETIMLQIGHYFQVQDDFLDCFGDVKKTGKGGTDIQDNKCSWLFVKAVQLCQSDEDREILRENYGEKDPAKVATVKKLYERLGLREAYHEYEDKTYEELERKIRNLPKDVPRAMFDELLGKLYKRKV